MKPTSQKPNPKAITDNEAAAFIVGAVTLFVPIMTFSDRGTGSLLDTSGLITFFVIASLGGALSLALYHGPGRRLESVIAGLIGGFCSFGLTVLYIRATGRTGLTNYEFMSLLGVGFAPGLLLLFWLQRRRQRAIRSRAEAERSRAITVSRRAAI